jgi:hypothetical protein
LDQGEFGPRRVWSKASVWGSVPHHSKVAPRKCLALMLLLFAISRFPDNLKSFSIIKQQQQQFQFGLNKSSSSFNLLSIIKQQQQQFQFVLNNSSSTFDLFTHTTAAF